MIDPLYLLFVAPAFLLSLLASWRVKRNFKRYSRVPASSGMTGAQAAQRLLDRAGIYNVEIKPTRGMLSDHYNPLTRTLALSESVYGSRSIAAIGVATHEAGHAIQHAKGYAPLKLRSAIVPMAGIGSNIGYLVMFIGLFLGSSGMVGIGALLFSAVVLFQLITLPVELDASARAKRLVVAEGIIGHHESQGVSKVLGAAAMTYVAAAASSILTLLYFLMRAGLLGGSDD